MNDIFTTLAVRRGLFLGVLLSGPALGCSLMAGYGMAVGKGRRWTHIIGFAAVKA